MFKKYNNLLSFHIYLISGSHLWRAGMSVSRPAAS